MLPPEWRRWLVHILGLGQIIDAVRLPSMAMVLTLNFFFDNFDDGLGSRPSLDGIFLQLSNLLFHIVQLVLELIYFHLLILNIFFGLDDFLVLLVDNILYLSDFSFQLIAHILLLQNLVHQLLSLLHQLLLLILKSRLGCTGIVGSLLNQVLIRPS